MVFQILKVFVGDNSQARRARQFVSKKKIMFMSVCEHNCKSFASLLLLSPPLPSPQSFWTDDLDSCFLTRSTYSSHLFMSSS